MSDIAIERIGSLAAFESLRGEWNELSARSGHGTVFRSWAWLYSWSEIYLDDHRELYILAVRRKGEILGIAPWVATRRNIGPFPLRTIGFLGTPDTSSDYLDVVTKVGREKDVAASLYAHLYREGRGGWDCLEFVDVPAESPFFLQFMNLLEEGGHQYDARAGSYCPTALLPGKSEDFFRNLSSSRRQAFNRESKYLAAHGDVKHRVAKGKDATDALAEFMELYDARWGRGDGKFAAFLGSYLRKVEETGGVRIDFLGVGGKTIGALVHLLDGGTAYMYLMAVDKDFDPRISVGNILVGTSIGDLINEGYAAYDFLKGEEPYKFHWTRAGARLMNVTCYNKKALPAVLYAGRSLVSLGKVVLR